jgi:peroxisomal 3,2-trans-enoyl-CoA isomerase
VTAHYSLSTALPDMLSHTIEGPVFHIHIANPGALNSFTIPQFVELAHFFDMADTETSTAITLLTAEGSFFSTGANIKHVSQITNQSRIEYYDKITSKNILLVHTILNHSKLIVAALNGPVIGLSAALVCLMDIIYARKEPPSDHSNSNSNDTTTPYMQFPFASIGLINECGVSASLPYRLGLTRALEAVSLARRISLEELTASGLVSRTFTASSVAEFNEIVQKEVLKLSKGLAFDSITENKLLIKQAFKEQVERQIVDESLRGLNRWVHERPQSAFSAMVLKNKHPKGKL